ncbi:MAG: PQQ-binding-like beta-propeller repeat protein, partial [Candidatus Acidiferrales bacterium]
MRTKTTSKAALLLLSLAFVVGAAPPGENDWPSFRGAHGAGIAEGQDLPAAWNGAKGVNIAWKASIPGLAHSSPVVWGSRVFVTTVVSSKGEATFKPGLYGAGTASEDKSVQKWMVLALDKRTGKILWERAAYEGTP